jgi:hypothetical protein
MLPTIATTAHVDHRRRDNVSPPGEPISKLARPAPTELVSLAAAVTSWRCCARALKPVTSAWARSPSGESRPASNAAKRLHRAAALANSTANLRTTSPGLERVRGQVEGQRLSRRRSLERLSREGRSALVGEGTSRTGRRAQPLTSRECGEEIASSRILPRLRRMSDRRIRHDQVMLVWVIAGTALRRQADEDARAEQGRVLAIRARDRRSPDRPSASTRSAPLRERAAHCQLVLRR